MSSKPTTRLRVDRRRRRVLLAGASAGALALTPALNASSVRAQAIASPPPEELEAAIKSFTQGAPVKTGKVRLDINPIVDNGNSVPVTITVESPMSATDYVKTIAMFNEKNPQRDVFRMELGPRSGKASVSTRVRLANSQRLVALAQTSDGAWWSHNVDVLVTLAACIDI